MAGNDLEEGWVRAKTNAKAIAGKVKPPPKKLVIPDEIEEALAVAKKIDAADAEVAKAKAALKSAYEGWTKISSKVIKAIT